LLISYVLGLAVGEIARRASGGFRDPQLARGAALFAAAGFAWRPLVHLASGGQLTQSLVFALLAAGIAAWAAYTRAV
jgi:hypothetical protein